MHTFVALLVALLVCVLPGAGLLLALRVRRPLWFLAASPAISVGVATATGMVCAPLGIPFGAASLGVVTLVLFALGVFWWRRDRRPLPRFTGLARWWRANTSTQRWGVLGGLALAVVGVGLVVRAWLSGMAGNLTLPPQEHDTIVHTELTAYIMHTGHGAPWQLVPVDLLSGKPVSFYPSGLHLMAAVTGQLTGGNALVGLNAVTVLLLGAWLAISLAALGYVAASKMRLGSAGAMLTAGLAAIVVAGLYRPVITLVTEGGILPNAAELALAPGIIAAILTIGRREWSAGIAAGIGCAGLVTLHPSVVVTVGVTVVAWWIGDLFTKGGPRRVLEQLPPLLVGVVATGVVAGPTMLLALSSGGRTSGFPPDFGQQPFGTALGQAINLTYGGYLPQYNGSTQVYPTLLLLVGVVAVLVSRRAYGVFAAWLAWVIVMVAALLNPGKGPAAVITGFLYNALLRISSQRYLLVPVLCALGIVLPAAAFARWLRRRTPVRANAGVVFVVLVLVVGLAYALVPGRRYMQIAANYIGTRYGTPDLVRVTPDDQAGFEFLAQHVQPGERVMNSANDGSTYMYVEKYIPVVENQSLGVATVPYTYHLLESFNQYPTNASIRKLVLDLNVGWVFVNSVAPPIGSGGAAENWTGDSPIFTFPAGLRDLDGLPGLTLAYQHGTVKIYQLDRSVLAGMGGSGAGGS